MKRRPVLIVGAVVIVVVALSVAVGLVMAQGPGDGEAAQVQVADVGLAAVANVIPVQGRLTDASGSPVNGARVMVFSIYDVSAGGVALCSDSDTVNVVNGLFTASMNFCAADDVNGRQLYLGIRVDADPEMTPRQDIYPVPYAFSLRPGAIISDTLAGDAILHVENWGAGGRGLRGYAMAESGSNWGVVGASRSPAGIGGYFYNTGGGIGLLADSSGTGLNGAAIKAYNDSASGVGVWAQTKGADAAVVASSDGSGDLFKGFGAGGGEDEFRVKNNGTIESKADSYFFIPGNALVKNLSTDTTRWDIQANGAARIWRGSAAGTKTVYLPVTIPAVLYGQPVDVESMTVYYVCADGTKGYIGRTVLNKQTDADSFVMLVDSATDHTSNTASAYTLGVNNVLSATQGALGLYLQLGFADDVNWVQIGGVRFQLGHHELY